MSYRKDQGRYARMLAFWSLTLLVAYGCFHAGGLVNVLDRWMESVNQVLIDPFPLIGQLKVTSCVAFAVLFAAAFAIHRILNRPKIADALIETETEMTKVTWPSWGEAWQGTMAVTGMVVVLFLFLTGVDLLLSSVVQLLMPGGNG